MSEAEQFPQITNLEVPGDSKMAEYKCNFTLSKSTTALANSLRRVMLSEIPNVGFRFSTDTTSELNDINILENTSVLHNEFFAQRLSMLPLCTYKSGRLNILSSWNSETGIRDTRFIEKVPEFLLNVSNTQAYREALGESLDPQFNKKLNKTSVIVRSDDFYFEEGEVADRVTDFLPPDRITNEHIILNKLKLLSDGTGEGVVAKCQLSIGCGKVNSLYSPVGTVAYSTVTASDAEVEEHHRLYVVARKQERIDKGLKPYTPDELEDINHTYRYLEAPRVHRRNARGDPEAFQFQVESIGGIYPLQIVSFAIQTLLWKIRDIRSSITLHVPTEVGASPSYKLNEKKLVMVESNCKMDAFDIVIENEDHTIGNLVSKCLGEIFCQETNKILSFVSYTKPHPLQDKIVIRLQVNPALDLVSFWETVKDWDDLLPELSEQLHDIDWSAWTGEGGNLPEFTTMFLFEAGLQYVTKVINRLNSGWTLKTNHLIEGSCKNKNFIRYAIEETHAEEEERLSLNSVGEQYEKGGMPLYRRIIESMTVG